jgi:deoxyadenosine/deoxycytidine kinase
MFLLGIIAPICIRKDPTPFVVSLEGLVGAGKSLMLSKLKSMARNDIVFIPEPIDTWTNFYDDNVLENFYNDKKEYGFIFESLVIQTMLHRQNMAGSARFIIMERSITSAKLFIAMQYKLKNIDKTKYFLLQGWCKIVEKANNAIKPNAYIVLNVDPKTALERIQIRARGEESNMSLEYLENLKELHQLMFGVKSNKIDLNANKNICEMNAEYTKAYEWMLEMERMHLSKF